MTKHGCVEKWSKETVQKKWHEMHLESDDYTEEYERIAKEQLQIDDFGMDDWSDGLPSVCHSLQGSDSGPVSAISTTTMDEVRDGQARDTSPHHLQIQQQQQQMMFENQQQHHQDSWNNGNS